MSKRVPCSYPRCGFDRVDYYGNPVVWSNPRPAALFDVPDDHPGPWYCSITCAVQDGAMTLRHKEPSGEAG